MLERLQGNYEYAKWNEACHKAAGATVGWTIPSKLTGKGQKGRHHGVTHRGAASPGEYASSIPALPCSAHASCIAA